MWQLQAKALIKEFEGLSLKPYKCLGGCNTIGYGHVIKNTNEDALFKNGIDASEAETLLLNDMNELTINCHCFTLISWSCTLYPIQLQ